MKHPNTNRTARRLLAAVCLSALAFSGGARAAAVLTGNATVNVGPNNYTYTYSVMNSGTLDDLAIVSVPAFSPLGVTNSFAPTGFSLAYDAFGGWANLIEDGSITTPQTFAPGATVGPFSFTSTYGPGPVTFVAYDAAGTEYTGQTVAPIPEPATALLGGLAAAAALVRRQRRTSSL